MIRVFVVLYEGFDASHLKFLDFFKPSEALEVRYASLDGRNIGNYATQMSLRYLEQMDPRSTSDVIFIPGAADVEKMFEADLIAGLEPFVVQFDRARDIIAVDTSILALTKIRTEAVMKLPESMRECAFAIPASHPEQESTENIIWQRSPVVTDNSRNYKSTWTACNGSPENLKSLAILLRSALRVDGFRQRPGRYPPLLLTRRLVIKEDEDYDQPEVASKEIRKTDKMDSWTFNLIHSAAGRLAAQGFLNAGTSILSALISDFPHCLDGVNQSIRWAFEFLWEAGGERPEGLPWAVPSPEELDEMEAEHTRGLYPSTPEENMTALELIDTKISLGDLPTYPCSLRAAAMICVAEEDLERARRYVDLEYKRIVSSIHMSEWSRLILCRTLAPIVLERGLGRAMGQTAEGAKKDAETIVAAFKSWPSREERLRKAREAVPTTPLSITALLDILEPSKAGDESLRKSPTPEKEISQVEARLGVSLPEDYRDFLLVSNGMNFMPPLELPGLRPVEELVWEEASDLGLDDLEMSLGMKMKEGESKSLPKMGRLLMISAAEDEEQVWLLEPSQVENTLDVLKTERGLKQFSQPVGWRVVLWRHWCPEPIWYRSFRKYLEAAATTAKKVS